MKINHKLINDLLKAVFPIPEQFGVDCDNELPNFLYLENDIQKVDPSAYIAYGMSKLVIGSPNLKGYVIKVPFNGYWSETYYEDEPNDELEWCDFYEAPTADCWDYCYAEYEKFKDLKRANLSAFVAETLFYKEIDGVKVFLQEKINLSYNGIITASIGSRKLAKQWKRERYYSMNLDWIAECIDYYGEKKTKKFLKYCDEIDGDILSDTHEGNYGYRDDGSPALLDYSGFFS